MSAVMSRALKNATIYGLAGFAIGFVFGVLRELVLIPQFGDRTGHLLEFPLVTVSIAIIGWLIGRKYGGQLGPAFIVGFGGLAVLLVIESAFALGAMGMSLQDYLASFDVTKGELFPIGLAVMAAAPPLACLSAKRSR